MAESTVQSPPPVAKPRKQRWWLRIFVALVVLVLLVVVAVEIVFRTNIPRSIVIAQLEKQLDLKVEAKSLSTGWMGHTRLSDVALSLPLAKQAFFKVPQMKVENSSLFSLLLGRSISVKAIELDDPTIYVWQEMDGTWNLAEVAQVFAHAGGQKPAEQSAQTSAPALPKLKIANGTIEVIDNQKRRTTINPLNVDGYASSALAYDYDVQVQPDATGNPRLGIKGRVAPGGAWPHEVEMQVHDIGGWISPWNSKPPPLSVDMQWSGQLSQSGIVGRLQSNKTVFSTAEAYGAIRVQAGAAGVRITPDNLLLKTGQRILPDLTLTSGAIEYAGSDLKVDQLMVSALGGPARIDGTFDKNARRADLRAMWSQITVGPAVKHSGSLTLNAQWPLQNQMQLNAHLLANGIAPGGPFNADVRLGANGSSWTDFDWTVDAPSLTWHRAVEVVLDNLHLVGGMHWKPIPNTNDRAPVLTLNSASLGGSQRLSGQGYYNFDPDKQDWNLTLTGRNWSLRPAGVQDLTFTLGGHGDKQIGYLDFLTFQNADATLTLDGTYTYGQPKPVRATVRLSNAEPSAGTLVLAGDQPPQVLKGLVSASASLVGTLSPLLLDVTGQLKGHEVDVLERHVGDLAAELSGFVNADRVDVRTNTLKVLDGDWNLEGIYLLDTDTAEVSLGVKDLALKQLGNFVGDADLTGSLSGQWNVYMPALSFEKNALEMDGNATLKDVHAIGFIADQITATTKLRNGQFAIDPIRLQRGDGRGEMHAAINLNDVRHLTAGASLTAWPIDVPGSFAHVDAWMDAPEVLVDLPDPQGKTPQQKIMQVFARQLELHGNVQLLNKSLGSYQVYAGVWGRMVDVRAAHLQLLGGRADGQARLDLNTFSNSTAEFTWANINATELGTFFPQLSDLRGVLNGTARLAPAEVSHPLEPLALVLKTEFVNGIWKQKVPVKDAVIIGFIGGDPLVPEGGYRFVLGSGPSETSTIHFDQGTLQLWGRASRHPHGALGIQGQLMFDALELNTLVHAYEPTAHEMPGKLSGNITLLFATPPAAGVTHAAEVTRLTSWPVQAPATGPSTAPTTQSTLKKILDPLYADGEVRLRAANLDQYKPINGLLAQMGKAADSGQSRATGDVRLHLERGDLSVTQMHYFNKGLEIRAVASVENIWNLPNSPLNGTAVGSLLPLSQTRMPLLADVNAILGAVQNTILKSIVIENTVRDPKWHPILFGDVGGDLKRMIVGDVRSGAAGAGQ